MFGRGIRLEFGDILDPTAAIPELPVIQTGVARRRGDVAANLGVRLRLQDGLLESTARSRCAPISLFSFPHPWIAYLSPAVSRGVVPPADMHVQHAPGGGLLLSATEERFDPANPEHLRRAQILAEAMIDRTGDKVADDNPP